MKNNSVVLLDCTLRDGGYYNDWDFSIELINSYLTAMQAAGVMVVELGLRSLRNEGFKGACAYTTDSFIRGLTIPQNIQVGVMVNAAELLSDTVALDMILQQLFPEPADSSPVSLVRIACHVHEFSKALPASAWLKERGFTVGFNLMQVADRNQAEIEDLSLHASRWPLDVLYFADSMGSMDPAQTAEIVGWLRKHWQGALGIHTHDNMSMALQNTLRALAEGVTWLDATVTGMGRGPGNAKTEYLVLELGQRSGCTCNMVPLMSLIRKVFQPMQHRCGWGTNTYYYLAGKYGIHPTYIQEMLSDSRYSDEDIIAVIEHLRIVGGKKFSLNTLEAASYFYLGEPRGAWSPASVLEGREVLLLGTGPGVEQHRTAIESYIVSAKPYVIALNTQAQLAPDLIDSRVACHPVRLLADCEAYHELPQPLITPVSMLSPEIRASLQDKVIYDFGLGVREACFEFGKNYAVLPKSIVVAYALAIVASGKAQRVLLAGFDGYEADDPRNTEMNELIALYAKQPASAPLLAITPTRYDIKQVSVYGL